MTSTRGSGRATLGRWLWLSAFIVGTATYALAEDITLTGYYPSPRGWFLRLRTTQATSLSTSPTGRVGIGEPTPLLKCEVVGSGRFTGNVQVNDGTAAADRVLQSQDGGGNAVWAGLSGTFSYF